MLYLVEDDKDIRELERYALTTAGFAVEAFSCSEEFFAACETAKPDLVLLDIMLPDEDGLSILRRLREESWSRRLPVMLVTAKTAELDTVRGLDLGADDYLTKPFGVLELVSRVKALLRRASADAEDATTSFDVGPLHLETDTRTVTVSGNPVSLTYKEFELLSFFMRHPKMVFSRQALLDQVWGFAFAGESRTVDMHVKTLREKLGEAGTLIRTVRSVGYKLEA